MLDFRSRDASESGPGPRWRGIVACALRRDAHFVLLASRRARSVYVDVDIAVGTGGGMLTVCFLMRSTLAAANARTAERQLPRAPSFTWERYSAWAGLSKATALTKSATVKPKPATMPTTTTSRIDMPLDI